MVPGRAAAGTDRHDRGGRRAAAWSVDDAAGTGAYRIRLAATLAGTDGASPLADPVGATCVAATLGLSPDRHGGIEGTRMEPDHRYARELQVTEIDSTFLSGFTTARPAPSYLLRDVQVTWSPAPHPAGLTLRASTTVGD